MCSHWNKKKTLLFTPQIPRSRFVQTLARLSIFELFMTLILYEWLCVEKSGILHKFWEESNKTNILLALETFSFSKTVFG